MAIGDNEAWTLALRALRAAHENREGDEARVPDPALMDAIYGELRVVADAVLRSTPPGGTLRTTALVNEAYLRLFGKERTDFRDRRQFFALASRVMRDLAIDAARKRRAQKRGGDRNRVELDEAMLRATGLRADAIDLDTALTELADLDPRQARIVELSCFGGLEIEEIATLLEVSKSTVERDWRMARAWLAVRLGER